MLALRVDRDWARHAVVLMATFRDLSPDPERPPEELAPPAPAAIRGETVAEAIARGVRIQIIPTVFRSPRRATKNARGESCAGAADD